MTSLTCEGDVSRHGVHVSREKRRHERKREDTQSVFMEGSSVFGSNIRSSSVNNRRSSNFAQHDLRAASRLSTVGVERQATPHTCPLFSPSSLCRSSDCQDAQLNPPNTDDRIIILSQCFKLLTTQQQLDSRFVSVLRRAIVANCTSLFQEQ